MIPEDARADAGRGGRGLEDILQLMVVIPVQAANLRRPLSPFHLSVDNAILGAVAGLQCQPAVSPELALGAEPMRRLYAADQDRRAQRPQKRNRLQPLGLGVFPALDDQLPARLMAQLLQGVQLLVKALGAAPQSASAECLQIFAAVLGSVQ